MPVLVQARAQGNAMGLETHGLSAYEGASTTLDMPFLNGKPAVVLTAAEKKAIKDALGFDFDSNPDYWRSYTVEVPHTRSPINLKDVNDVIKLAVLRHVGLLAPSVAAASHGNSRYRFILENPEQEAELKMTTTMAKNKAVALLVDIHSKEPKYCQALAKYLVQYYGAAASSDIHKSVRSSTQYTVDTAYIALTDLIEGKITGGDAPKAVDMFLNALDPQYGGKLTKEHLFVWNTIFDGVKMGVIKLDNNSKIFYNPASPGSNYGRTLSEVFDFLSSPLNSDHLGIGADKDHPYAVRYQIKMKK